jgi:haloacetate dehalogenase
MAADCLALMDKLGHQSFTVVGQDRGGYVATRLALDHPEAVTRLTILGDIRIGEALSRCDARFAAAWWHWFLPGQTDKPAEMLISRDPGAWYGATSEQLGDAWEEFRAAIHDPETVRAMCEDYRAGLGIDCAHDDTDRSAGRRITCLVQVLWAIEDDLTDLHGDILPIWRQWADDVTGHAIGGGHHMAEEAPIEVAAALTEFWS